MPTFSMLKTQMKKESKPNASTPKPGSLAPNTPQPGAYLQKTPDEIYNPADIASMKARATLSATRGANAGIAGAARMGMDNPAYALLAQRARSGATVQAANQGRDIETTARESNAGLLMDKERLAQSAGGLSIQSDANQRAAEMAAIMKQLQQLQLSSARRENRAEAAAEQAATPSPLNRPRGTVAYGYNRYGRASANGAQTAWGY